MNEDWTGLIIGRKYEIKEKLGSGQVAVVFAAYDQKLGRQVAIKIVRPEYARSPEVIATFVREARIIAKLEHPNILSIYALGTQTVKGQRLIYLVMRLASRGTLAKRLETGVLTPHEAHDVLKQVCEALDYAHHQEVLHLDLKPLNILFDEHGNALVADFGLAKLLQGASRVKADTGFGTPIYMPPEQSFGHKVGPFSDVYALGITLYQMLTGKLPELDWKDPSLLPCLDRLLPPRIQDVIEKATQSDPDKRYRTAGELAQAFAAAIAPSAPDSYKRDMGEVRASDLPSLEGSAEALAASKSLLPKKSWIQRVGIGLTTLTIIAGLVFLGQRWWDRQAEAMLEAFSLTLTASSTDSAVPMATLYPSPTPAPSATIIPTAPPTPTPMLYAVVSVEQSHVYAGPGENYDELGIVRRGDRLLLYGRSEDGIWSQVDHLGRKGWIPIQAVAVPIEPTLLPTVTAPPTPIRTPTPTATPSLPTPNTVVSLQNPGFEGIHDNLIPGWHWWAEDNFLDKKCRSDPCFDTPSFSQTNDPARMIDGATLQIEATAFVGLKVYVLQTVSVSPTVPVRFEAWAKAYSDLGGIQLAAGIEPSGSTDCSQAQWGDTLLVDQSQDPVRLVAPTVAVGQAGRVTVCLYAASVYPAHNNAAYFGDASLIANPQ